MGIRSRHSPRQARAARIGRGDGGQCPHLADFNDFERMVGEYAVMGIHPNGHLMEHFRPSLGPEVLPTVAIEDVEEGKQIQVAGWPVARQHPRGRDGTVFVTIEDEVGSVQLILWPRVFARHRRALGSQVILAKGKVSRWDGTTNVIVSAVQALDTRCLCLPPTTGIRHRSRPQHAPQIWDNATAYNRSKHAKRRGACVADIA